MKHIYLSPHSDDVALSCGGQILANPSRGTDTLILNVFTSQAEDVSQELGKVQRALFDSVNAERSTEDAAAWRFAGVESHYLNLPESLLRNRFPFRLGPRRDDPQVASALHGALLAYVAKHPDATFHFPAGIGSHVDHLACRDAAFRLLDEGALAAITLYEDVPYSWLRFVRDQSYRELLRSVELSRQTRAQAFRRDGYALSDYLRSKAVPFPRGKKLFLAVYLSMLARSASPRGLRRYNGTVRTVDLDDRCQAQKKSLILHYKSQIPMLFGDRMHQVIERSPRLFATEVAVAIER
jgi:LmbE family N-acetylglucosaminyl deacetylase